MRTLTHNSPDRHMKSTQSERQFTLEAYPRETYYDNDVFLTQDDQSWTTWGQTNIRVFHPGYTKPFGDLP